MKKTIFIILILSTLNLFSQNYTINGYVNDIETGEKIVNATIRTNNGEAVFSNEYGYYSLNIKNLQNSKITLTATMLGYSPISKTIDLNSEKRADFYLKSNTQIDSIIITGQIPITQTTEIGTVEIPVKQIQLMPAIGAESDVFKSLQLMPGIQAGSEGTSNLFVRGGAPDENLILLDDVPMYYVNHLGGFISVFNTDALNSVKMIKGGFPARYGSRLSSVLDIRMKDGDLKNYHGNFTLGLINTKILYEGPIINDKASFIISARILPVSLFAKPFFLLVNEGQMFGYNFHDINAKINYKLNNKNHFYLSFYTGDDRVSVKLSQFFINDQKLKYNLTWGNRLFAARWNHIFTQKLFSNTTLSYTRFRYDNSLFSENSIQNTSFDYNFNTGIKDVILKSTFDYNTSKNYKIKFGINSIYHSFNPGVTYYKITETDTIKSETEKVVDKFLGFENRLFIENNISISSFFKANLGVNFSDYYLDSNNYISYEPRIVLNVILPADFSLKASYSEMAQYVHLLTNNSVGLNPDIWVPSCGKIPPSHSKQISFGIFKHFKQKDIELSIISYYKTSKNLIAYKEGAVFNGNAQNWQDKIETKGNGTAYGLEILLQKKQGKTTGWISYTYANSFRQFKNINLGEPYAFKYDRRHDFSIVVNHKINENISVSADWVYGSGYPYTMPIATYNIIDDGTFESYQTFDFQNNQNVFIYANRNDFRMRAYHRLDLAAKFTKEVKRGIRTWTVSIYNAYSRQNPYFYYSKYNPETKKIHLYQQSLFPIIPSVSYSLKF